MPTTKGFGTVLMVVALVATAGLARADTLNCTPITSLPAVITVQGVYCLTGDLSTAITAGAAIDIQTSHVVLDLNGFKLGGLAAGSGTTTRGIRAADRQNITIKNGTVRGFFYGIALTDVGASRGHVVERVRADQNRYVGMAVDGSDNLVRNNQVVATGGSTTFGANADAFGIVILGSGTRVIDNDITGIEKQGSGTAWGIFFGSGTGGVAVKNRITRADVGIDYSGSTGKYRDNVTFEVTTPYTGGTNAGNNN